MRISDWSSDVCSSDLSRRASARLPPTYRARTLRVKPQAAWLRRWWAALLRAQAWRDRLVLPDRQATRTPLSRPAPPVLPLARARGSDERRVGKEWLRACSSRWSPYP